MILSRAEIIIFIAFCITLSVGQTNARSVRNRRTIYPGTQYCGAGNIDKYFPDGLVLFDRTDACCREHDRCPRKILAGETKYQYYNDRLFTFSHCDCDNRFKSCLEEVGNDDSWEYYLAAAPVALAYQAIYGGKCFVLQGGVAVEDDVSS